MTHLSHISLKILWMNLPIKNRLTFALKLKKMSQRIGMPSCISVHHHEPKISANQMCASRNLNLNFYAKYDRFFGHFGTKIQILWILLIIDWTNTPVIRNSSNSQNGIQKSQKSVRKANSVPDMILSMRHGFARNNFSGFFFTFFQTSNKSF